MRVFTENTELEMEKLKKRLVIEETRKLHNKVKLILAPLKDVKVNRPKSAYQNTKYEKLECDDEVHPINKFLSFHKTYKDSLRYQSSTKLNKDLSSEEANQEDKHLENPQNLPEVDDSLGLFELKVIQD